MTGLWLVARSTIRLVQAEGEGFEPSVHLTTHNGFRDKH
jgi:hypothetical protein